MRSSLRALLLGVGLLLAVLGSIGAVFIGPDDSVKIGEKQVPERAKGVAVRTHPEITKFVNIDMMVVAKADGGVFLGTSHRIDTESLLYGKRYFEITKLSLGNVGGVYTEGAPRATRKVLRPERLVGWLDSATGDEAAELVVPLEGDPLDIVAVPTRRNARVTISIGAHVTGLFWGQVGVAVTGVAMIALSRGIGWWLRRRENSADDADDESGDDSDGEDGSGGEPVRTSAARAPRATDHPGPLRLPQYPGSRRVVVALFLLPLALLLSACGVPGSAPSDSGKETRTGMSLSEAQAVVEGATQVYAEEFEAYPMWSLAGAEKPRRLHLLTRDSFASPWRTEARVRVRGDFPEPVGRAIPAGGILTERAEEVAGSIAVWWSSGEADGLSVDRRTRRARESLLASGVSPWSIWVADPPYGTPPLRIVEVATGHLAVVEHMMMTPAPRRLTTIVFFPSQGRPKVLGSSLVEVD